MIIHKLSSNTTSRRGRPRLAGCEKLVGGAEVASADVAVCCEGRRHLESTLGYNERCPRLVQFGTPTGMSSLPGWVQNENEYWRPAVLSGPMRNVGGRTPKIRHRPFTNLAAAIPYTAPRATSETQ